VVEHQIARCDDGRPVDDGLGEIGAGVVAGDGDAVVVDSVGDEGPAVVLAGFD